MLVTCLALLPSYVAGPSPIPAVPPPAASSPVACVSPPRARLAHPKQDVALRGPLRRQRSAAIEAAVDSACRWLATHQDVDGKWDADAFTKHDGAGAEQPDIDDDAFWDRVLLEDDPLSNDNGAERSAAKDAGDPAHDVGVSGLALLALLDDGNTPDVGAHKLSVARGVEWLLTQQNDTTGLFGPAEHHAVHYDHAIALLALSRVCLVADGAIGSGRRASTAATRLAAVQKAVDYALAARNPYGAWRYESPPNGDNDSSITTWMTLALLSAQDAGATVDAAAFDGARAWFEEMTDPDTGRVGYSAPGSRSARMSGVNEQFNAEYHETLTAGALLTRLRMGLDARSDEAAVRQVKLLIRTQARTVGRGSRDMIELRWGTEALALVDSRPWEMWSDRVTTSLLRSRATEGDNEGSWGPESVWGAFLGRVGTTALAASSLARVEHHGTETSGSVAEPRATRKDEIPSAASGTLRAAQGPARLEVAIERSLAWLVEAQAPAGHWTSDATEPAGTSRAGAPPGLHDVGVTGLAILTFLGDGQTPYSGPNQATVKRGVVYLMEAQDPETGLIGPQNSTMFMYNHAIAALALTEAYMLTKATALERRAQAAVNYIARARNPYGAWRYDVPPNGDNDTSITAWMIQVIRSAEDAGLKIDRAAYDGALGWVDQVTDPETGRVGYVEPGSMSARIPGRNDAFPADHSEALTAAGLFIRLLCGEDPDEQPLLQTHADLLLQNLPAAGQAEDGSVEPGADGRVEPGANGSVELGADVYALYFGTRALYQLGGSEWDAWRHHVEPILLATQSVDGAALGSWDPSGPWGFAGGRVYSTAMQTMTAQALARYAAILRPLGGK